MLSIVAQSGFNLRPFIQPDTAEETLLFYSLTTLNFLAFITVLFVLLRNVIKLVREKRAGRAGSKFKARLVSYAIGLSLLPVLLLFFFAFGLLNLSIDRWFGEPARQMAEDAKAIQEHYFRKEKAELLEIAGNFARQSVSAEQVDSSPAVLEQTLKGEVTLHSLSVIRLVEREKRYTVRAEGTPVESEIEGALAEAQLSFEDGEDQFTGEVTGELSDATHIVAGLNLSNLPSERRFLILARQVPPELAQQAANIKEQHTKFALLRGKIKGIKSSYVLLLGAVTLLLIFSASWLALYVARGISVPIQALAEATERVAVGDFSKPVIVDAEDELAGLVSQFNQMAGQLGENREKLELAASDLHAINQTLESRRHYIETVLESLSTGVISVDHQMGLTTINRAALFMLGIERRPDDGTPIELLTDQQQGEEIASLCRRARRTGTAQSEIEFKRANGSLLHAATTAISLKRTDGDIEGWVIVIEDLTDLIQAERAAAWSEVARRMAHEIKNPLTPIQLSAERIIRNYDKGSRVRTDPRFEEIVREGTSTIVREVMALQRMVEEFSRFARLPEARLDTCSLNGIVKETVQLYVERLEGIGLECVLDPELPELQLDREQIKQVLVNLIDNAVEALNTHESAENSANRSRNGNGNGAVSAGKESRLIRIETSFAAKREAVRLTVSDNGHGIKPSDRDKLFLPKFSTRQRGTGLGLAIVSHIIADHGGRVWVADNRPCGARFVVEFRAEQAG